MAGACALRVTPRLAAPLHRQVDLVPRPASPVCRHSVVVAEGKLWTFGGWKGDEEGPCADIVAVDLAAALAPPLQRPAEGAQAPAAPAAATLAAAAAPVVSDIEDPPSPGPAPPALAPAAAAVLWKLVPPPLSVADLPDAGAAAALPAWKLIRRLHDAAVVAGREQYIDPASGYTVFTSKYLAQRECCGNGCRWEAAGGGRGWGWARLCSEWEQGGHGP
jgi:hypothetical protein